MGFIVSNVHQPGRLFLEPEFRRLLPPRVPDKPISIPREGIEPSIISSLQVIDMNLIRALIAAGKQAFAKSRIVSLLAVAALFPDLASAQGAIRSGESLVGEILPAGDSDTWTFEATAGDSFLIRVGELVVIGDLQPRIRILDPAGHSVGTAKGFNDAEFDGRATNSGTYTIVVDAVFAAGTGTYRLHLIKVPGEITVSSGEEGGAIENGETKDATLRTGDLDAWTFNAAAGDSIVVRVSESTVSPDIQPRVRIFSPTGVLIADGQGFNDAEVSAKATNSGSFTIVVSAVYAGGAGTYRLHLVKAPGEFIVSPGEDGGPIANGETKEGTIKAGDLDMWSFHADSGDNVVVRVGEVTVTPDIQPRVRIYSPLGVLIADGQGFNDTEVSVKATNSGSFIIVVSAVYAGGAGTYRLHLVKAPGEFIVSPGEEGGPITNGETKEGTIKAGDLDMWSFHADSGDNVVVRVGEVTVTPDLQPRIRIYSPLGVLIADGQGFNSAEVSVRTTNTGRFTIIVSAVFAGGAGTYQLHLIKAPGDFFIPVADEGGPITPDSALTGSIQFGDMDPWVFTGCEGEAISIQIDELSGGSGFQPRIRLFGRDGTLLDNKAGASTARIDLKAPATGNYTIVVSDASGTGNGTGGYKLNVRGRYQGLQLCIPIVSGPNIKLNMGGGQPGAEYVISSTTNISIPLGLWVPVATNRFGIYGESTFSEPALPGVMSRFFRTIEK